MNTYNIPLTQPQTSPTGMPQEPLYNINYQMPYYQQPAPAPAMPPQPQYAPAPSQPQYAPAPTQPQYPAAPANYGSNPVDSIPVAMEVQTPQYPNPQMGMNPLQRTVMLKAGSTFITCPYCHSQVKTVVSAPKWVLFFPLVFFIFFIAITMIAIFGDGRMLGIVFPIGFFIMFFLMVCLTFIPSKSPHKCPHCGAVVGRRGDVIRC